MFTPINSLDVNLLVVPAWGWLILSFLASTVCGILVWIMHVKNNPTDLKVVLVFIMVIIALFGLVQSQTSRNITERTTAEVVQSPEII